MNIHSLITAMQEVGVSPEKILETIKIATKEDEEKAALKRDKERLRKRAYREKLLNINDCVPRDGQGQTGTPRTDADTVSPDGFNGFPNPSLTSFTPSKENTPKGVQKKVSQITIPDWLPLQPWEEFKAMRNKIKKPMTSRAEQLAIGKLEQFRSRGHDPTEILNQSILNDYQDLYEPKKNGGNYGKQEQPKSQMQRAIEATERARLAREQRSAETA